MPNKVFILGLDGATFNIILPMIKDGKLPTLSRIIREGTHCILNSTILTNSAPAWTSFATGKNPGKHSISGFTKLLPNSYQLKLLRGSDNKAETLWEIIGEHGKRSIIVNIPMTYPPKKINGILISGMDAPSLSSNFTYPPELKDELLNIVPDYKINLNLGGYLYNDRRRRKAIDMMLSSIRAREKAVLYLMRNYPWDFFTVRFNSPDNVQHYFWRFMDKNHTHFDPNSPDVLKNAIYTIYEELDKVAFRIINSFTEKVTLIIMSDHGAGPRADKSIRVNEWLQSLGYLTSKASSQKHYILEKLLPLFLKVVPPHIKQRLIKIFPNIVSKTRTYLRFPNIEWSQTKVFAGESEGIRINLKDIYLNGIVEFEEYEKLRNHVISEIKKLKDNRTGEHIFQHAFKREDIFSGPYVNEFPEIITITTRDQYHTSPRISQNIRKYDVQDSFIVKGESWKKVSGSHRREGIFMIHGNGIKKNTKIATSEITDIFPTVMYLLGLPVPSDIDGHVITDAFTDEYLKNNPIKYEQIEEKKKSPKENGEEYTKEEINSLIDNLRGLGYIE